MGYGDERPGKAIVRAGGAPCRLTLAEIRGDCPGARRMNKRGKGKWARHVRGVRARGWCSSVSTHRLPASSTLAEKPGARQVSSAARSMAGAARGCVGMGATVGSSPRGFA
jgi:hypothetical protein